jgi:hypothetical protein
VTSLTQWRGEAFRGRGRPLPRPEVSGSRHVSERDRRLCHTGAVTSREDIHRLVDALPAARLPAVEQLLRASLEEAPATKRRQFASAGTLSAERDLAERSEDILRSDEAPHAADRRDAPSA